MEQLKLTQEWDKVFPKNDKVEHSKATFHNRYGIALAVFNLVVFEYADFAI